MSYTNIVSKVSKELGIPEEVVDKAYKSYWKFIKNTIKILPLKDNLNEEEFSKLRTNFNIPSLGKLVCTFDSVVGIKNRYKHIKILRNAKS